jgi:hypothetical protein
VERIDSRCATYRPKVGRFEVLGVALEPLNIDEPNPPKIEIRQPEDSPFGATLLQFGCRAVRSTLALVRCLANTARNIANAEQCKTVEHK